MIHIWNKIGVNINNQLFQRLYYLISILDKFYDAGVRKIFCGHYHRNTGGWYKDLEVIVTSAIGCQIGDDPHGMRLVKVHEEKVEHAYHGLDTCPVDIDLNLK